MFDFLIKLGVIGLVLTVMLVAFLPLVLTVIVGTGIADLLGFSGIVWWAFVILFWIVITSILSKG